MLEISLINFLKTGTFDSSNQIHFGMERDKIMEVLGQPDGDMFYSNRSKFPSLYTYGKVEFYLEPDKSGRLLGIQYSPIFFDKSHEKLVIKEGFINKDLEINNAVLHLEQAAIEHQLLDLKYDQDTSQIIETEGKIKLIFTKQGDRFLLLKISKFIQLADNKPPEKQINLPIPLTAYEQLRQMAIQQRKSIRHLCREFILEGLKKEEIEKDESKESKSED